MWLYLRKPGILGAMCNYIYKRFIISVHKIAKSADMNELTFDLRFTTLIATKTDLPKYNKLELPNVSIAQNRQLRIHGACCYGHWLEIPAS